MVAPDRDALRRAFRLDRGKPPAGALSEQRAETRSGELRAFLGARLSHLRPAPRAAVALPEGTEVITPHGTIWRRELHYGPDQAHGSARLGACRALCGDRLAALAKDPSFSAVDPRQCLFLDTETTGLSGGAGTVVFAYGLGFWRREHLVVEQLFLRDFGEEPAMLQHVAARLREFPLLVTFVGKSYDRHRIAARMALHKMPAPVLTQPHLDLYHLVRRARRDLPDARLGTVERHVLGFERADDLPGSEAPAAFLAWIRDRTGPVDRVLEHNRLDVLSLVALLGALAARDHSGTDKPPARG